METPRSRRAGIELKAPEFSRREVETVAMAPVSPPLQLMLQPCAEGSPTMAFGASTLAVAAFLLGRQPTSESPVSASPARTATIPVTSARSAPSAPAVEPSAPAAPASPAAATSGERAQLTLLGDGTLVSVDGSPRGACPPAKRSSRRPPWIRPSSERRNRPRADPGSSATRAGHAPRGEPSTLTSVPSPRSVSCARSPDVAAAGEAGAAGADGSTAGAEGALRALVTGMVAVRAGLAETGRSLVAALPRRNAATASVLAPKAIVSTIPLRGVRASARGSVSSGAMATVSTSRLEDSGAFDSILRVEESPGFRSGDPGVGPWPLMSSRAAKVLVPASVAEGLEGGLCRILVAVPWEPAEDAREGREPGRLSCRARSPRLTRKESSERAAEVVRVLGARPRVERHRAPDHVVEGGAARTSTSLGLGCGARMAASHLLPGSSPEGRLPVRQPRSTRPRPRRRRPRA